MVVKLLIFRREDCTTCDEAHATWDRLLQDHGHEAEFRDVRMPGSGEQNDEPVAVAAYQVRPRDHPTLILEHDRHEVRRWTLQTLDLPEVEEAMRRAIAREKEHARDKERPPPLGQPKPGTGSPPPQAPPPAPPEPVGPEPEEPPWQR